LKAWVSRILRVEKKGKINRKRIKGLAQVVEALRFAPFKV
jgi:hypothetical protein